MKQLFTLAVAGVLFFGCDSKHPGSSFAPEVEVSEKESAQSFQQNSVSILSPVSGSAMVSNVVLVEWERPEGYDGDFKLYHKTVGDVAKYGLLHHPLPDVVSGTSVEMEFAEGIHYLTVAPVGAGFTHPFQAVLFAVKEEMDLAFVDGTLQYDVLLRGNNGILASSFEVTIKNEAGTVILNKPFQTASGSIDVTPRLPEAQGLQNGEYDIKVDFTYGIEKGLGRPYYKTQTYFDRFQIRR